MHLPFLFRLPQVGAITKDLMRARILANSAPGMATTAICNTVLRAWLVTLAPILTSLSWMLESDQWDTLLGRAKRLRKFPRL